MSKLIAILTIVLLAAFTRLDAGQIKHPKSEPAFTITISDDWKAHWDEKGNLSCSSAAGDEHFSIIPVGENKTWEYLKDYLPRMARKSGQDWTFQDLKVTELEETTTPRKLKLLRISTHGTRKGAKTIIKIVAFKTHAEKFFVVLSMGPDNEKFPAKVDAAIASITPLAAAN
jgi:hypothetical protein